MYHITGFCKYAVLTALAFVFLLSVAPQAHAWGDFTTKHTIYVGCTGVSPNYVDLPPAVAAAKPYTLITVCPGTYSGGSVSTTDHLKIKGKGTAKGVVVDCNNQVGQTGIEIEAAHDFVDNLTVQNCPVYGVEITNQDLGFVQNVDSRVLNSLFNNNGTAVSVTQCDQCQVTSNQVSVADTEYGIEDDYTTGDIISGNKVDCGGHTNGTDGLYIVADAKATVTGNTAQKCEYGFEFNTNADSKFSDNTAHGNVEGFYFDADNINNLFQGNTANNNTDDGVFLNTPNGADVVPNAPPNKFEKNTAKGNGSFDLQDGTFGCGLTDNTCNIWHQNKATVCNPSSICAD